MFEYAETELKIIYEIQYKIPNEMYLAASSGVAASNLWNCKLKTNKKQQQQQQNENPC